MTHASYRRCTPAGPLPWVLFISLMAVVSGCYRYVVFPVNTKVEALSVAYVLRITNDTGGEIHIRPNSTGESKGFTADALPRGQSFDSPLQLRKLKVGTDVETPTHEVVSSAYIEMAGQPNVARIIVEYGAGFSEVYDLDIDLENEHWFDTWELSKPEPKTLIIKLTDFSKSRWFRGGPEKP
jgi:hypothetical protein